MEWGLNHDIYENTNFEKKAKTKKCKKKYPKIIHVCIFCMYFFTFFFVFAFFCEICDFEIVIFFKGHDLTLIPVGVENFIRSEVIFHHWGVNLQRGEF